MGSVERNSSKCFPHFLVFMLVGGSSSFKYGIVIQMCLLPILFAALTKATLPGHLIPQSPESEATGYTLQGPGLMS